MKPKAEFITRSRELRKRETVEEGILWQKLRNRNLCGKKFLRQHPIVFQFDTKARYFIADFYCSEHNLVIEIDGGYHETMEQKEYDAWRDEIIKAKNLAVLRFKNEEVGTVEKVLEKIKAFLLNPTVI